MDKATFVRLSNEIDIEIASLKNRQRRLKAQFISGAPFQIGDKVEVRERYGDLYIHIAYIRYVGAGCGADEYMYGFYKSKIDGTCSKHILRVEGNILSITKIN